MSPIIQRGRVFFLILATIIVVDRLSSIVLALKFESLSLWRSVLLPLMVILGIISLWQGEKWLRWLMAGWLLIHGGTNLLILVFVMYRMAEIMPSEQASFFRDILAMLIGFPLLHAGFYIFAGLALLLSRSLKSFFDHQEASDENSFDERDTSNSMNADTPDDEWQKTWNARLAALERELGKSDNKIATSLVPIYLGGGADVLTFKNHIDGVAYVTAGLIGNGSQKRTDIGEYELMMCFRQENDWAPSLLSRLAPYTFEVALEHGETMDIASAMPSKSTITALLFVSYRQFTVNEAKAGILLCIGITESELAECQANGFDAVTERLKDSGVFPFTDPERNSSLSL